MTVHSHSNLCVLFLISMNSWIEAISSAASASLDLSYFSFIAVYSQQGQETPSTLTADFDWKIAIKRPSSVCYGKSSSGRSIRKQKRIKHWSKTFCEFKTRLHSRQGCRCFVESWVLASSIAESTSSIREAQHEFVWIRKQVEEKLKQPTQKV